MEERSFNLFRLSNVHVVLCLISAFYCINGRKKRAGREEEGGPPACNVIHGHEADSMELLSELASKTCRVQDVTHSNTMKLLVRRERLTDAFTKMLMPGTSAREMSACACNMNRVLLIERSWLVAQSEKAPKRMKQSGSAPEDSRLIWMEIHIPTIVMMIHCQNIYLLHQRMKLQALTVTRICTKAGS